MTTSTTYRVSGMTCGHCAKTVERAARATPGVAAARVDLRANTLTIEGRPDAAALAAALAEAGYEVEA